MERSSTGVHATAAQGFSVGAEDYARGRPGYPPEVSAWLRDRLGARPGATVVELGAGTGKFTPRLLETGARVIAVEPVAAMLARLTAALPGVETVCALAEALPIEGASIDAVVCAQAFHWFANRAALTEIHRVLRPGGALGLVWNQRDARVGWVARLDAIMNRREGDAPRYRSGAWRSVFPFPGLGPLREQRFSHVHTGPPEDVLVSRVKSTSFIATLSGEERSRVEAEVRTLIASEPDLAGKPVAAVPYETAAFDAVKTTGTDPTDARRDVNSSLDQHESK